MPEPDNREPDLTPDLMGCAAGAFPLAQHPDGQIDLLGQVTKGDETADTRTELDAYYTPIPLVRALLEAALPLLELEVGSEVLEPSAGGGNWARELATRGFRVHAVDVDPNAWVNLAGRSWSESHEHEAGFGKLRTRCLDFLSYQPGWVRLDERPTGTRQFERAFHLGAGNPPFNQAESHARHALSMSDRVLFLLRTGFLESQERGPFWDQFGPHLTDVWFLRERPREWKASYSYAGFLWDQTRTVDHFRGHLLSWR